MIKPDIGIVLEADIAGDVQRIIETDDPTKIGKRS